MKKCCTCKKRLSLKKFSKNKRFPDGLSPNCGSCKYKANRRYALKRREELHILVIEYLRTHPCVDCGEDDPVVLDFDHQRDKYMSVADLCNKASSPKRVLEEINKCEVRCKNCHYKKTAVALGHRRALLLK